MFKVASGPIRFVGLRPTAKSEAKNMGVSCGDDSETGPGELSDIGNILHLPEADARTIAGSPAKQPKNEDR